MFCPLRSGTVQVGTGVAVGTAVAVGDAVAVGVGVTPTVGLGLAVGLGVGTNGGATGMRVAPPISPDLIGKAELAVTVTGLETKASRNGVSSRNWQPIVTRAFAPGLEPPANVGAGNGVGVEQLIPAMSFAISVWYSEPAAHDAVGFTAA